MSRIKLTLVAALVAAVAFAASSAAASAHQYKVEGTPVSSSTNLKAASFTGSYVLTGKPFLVAVHIECTKVHETGTVGSGGTGTATLEFSSCTTTKPANCKAKEPIVTEVNTNLLSGLEIAFSPKGSAFTTVTLEGTSCSLKEPFSVTGTQNCALPGGETEAVAHELACSTAGSKLEAGGKPATFQGSVNGLELESGLKWSAE